MLKKIALFLIKSLLILFFSVTFLGMLAPEKPISYFIIFNILIIFIFENISIILHEIGHVIWGYICRFDILGISLGNGNPFTTIKLFKLRITINKTISSGYTYIGAYSDNFIKLRLILLYSGGFMFQFLIIYLILSQRRFDIYSITASNNIAFTECFIISNILLIISSLIPHKMKLDGQKINNDGMNILQLLFMKKEKVSNLVRSSKFNKAWYYSQIKDFEKSINCYEKIKEDKDLYFNSTFILSILLLQQGEITKSIENLEEIIDHPESKNLKHILQNNLAWSYLILEDEDSLSMANYYSELSFNLNQELSSINGTRGTILIELGKIEEGTKLLKNNLLKHSKANPIHPLNLVYFIYGNYLLGNTDEIKKAEKIIKHNNLKLNLSDQILLEKVLNKCDYFNKNPKLMKRIKKQNITKK